MLVLRSSPKKNKDKKTGVCEKIMVFNGPQLQSDLEVTASQKPCMHFKVLWEVLRNVKTAHYMITAVIKSAKKKKFLREKSDNLSMFQASNTK